LLVDYHSQALFESPPGSDESSFTIPILGK
jgi:hypothetical protein